MIPSDEIIISQTKKWITDVVVGCNFCPFAGRELNRGTIQYKVLPGAEAAQVLSAVNEALAELDNNSAIETTLLILPSGVENFEDYLDLLAYCEDALIEAGYEGIYQLASFHPEYLFGGASPTDPANYTNRSPYPMLHFLREDSVSKAVDNHPDIDSVPATNIQFANEKGLIYMKQLLASCL